MVRRIGKITPRSGLVSRWRWLLALGLLKRRRSAPEPILPPPGPYDLAFPTNDALISLTIPYNSVYGNIIVRITARNNENVDPGLTVSWKGIPLTKAGDVVVSSIGGPLAYIFAIKDTDTGGGDIVITCSTGSAGVAIVRIGDVYAYDSIGRVDSAVLNQYYYEVVFDDVLETSNITIIAMTPSTLGYPFIYDNYFTEQWNTIVNGSNSSTSALMAQTQGPHGDAYFVVEPNTYAYGVILGVEFLGLQALP